MAGRDGLERWRERLTRLGIAHSGIKDHLITFVIPTTSSWSCSLHRVAKLLEATCVPRGTMQPTAQRLIVSTAIGGFGLRLG